MTSETRGAIYKIRWAILVMAASLVLSAIVVLAIPNDFTTKMLEEQKEERAKAAEEKAKSMLEQTPETEENMTKTAPGGTQT